jgi:GNAT superfamily N-acetyltransferase
MSGTPNSKASLPLPEPISRLVGFYKRNGFKATLQRTGLSLRRLFSSNRMVLFYCDLSQSTTGSTGADLPTHLKVERKKGREEIIDSDWRRMTDFWNPQVSQELFCSRFRQGASLWLIRFEGGLAGYGWTMAGRTVEPHYHPLGATDIHLFDFLVFPEYRGRNLNPQLVGYILQESTVEGSTRAYIEVREWNRPQLISLGKTNFRLLGLARKVSLFGRTFVEWANPQRKAEVVQIAPKETGTVSRARITSR